MDRTAKKKLLAKQIAAASAVVIILVILLLVVRRRGTDTAQSSTKEGDDDVPFLILPRGSGVKVKPERLSPPANNSDIYISVLTAPVYHDKRFAVQYLTWLQTVDVKNVRVITDSEDNKWIQAFKKDGGTVVIPKCPISKLKKSAGMMCCKSGAQYDYWYRAREAGKKYKWYCHVDDDLYLNLDTLVEMLKHYDPSKDWYIGNWKVVEKYHKYNRIPASRLAPGLLTYDERKRDDFRYANGPAFCISEALMMKVEKYMRGKNYETHCKKSRAVMDDILSGVIIEGVLGIDVHDTDVFKGQLDNIMYYRSNDPEGLKKMKREVTIGFTGFVIKRGAFNYVEDPYGIFSYHCLLHPSVSWCKKKRQ